MRVCPQACSHVVQLALNGGLNCRGQFEEIVIKLPRSNLRRGAVHAGSLRLVHANATFPNILFAALNLCFEFVGELQLVFHHVTQPIQKRFPFSFGQLLNLFFDLFERRHAVI
jgi:hypothetical protein